MSTLAPWQQRVYDQAVAALASGRMGHALLLCGPEGMGKRALAERLAAHVLGQGDPAHAQRAAQLLAAGTHPDLHVVTLEPNRDGSRLRSEIVIEQVRELSQQLALTPQYGEAQVAIIDPAEALNTAACNALLKTLEEPAPGRYLWLVSSRPARLPATIRSRCQKLAVPAPDREAALAWLTAERPQHRNDWPKVLDVLGVAPLAALEADLERILAIRADIERVLDGAAQGRLDVIRVAHAWAGEDLPLRLAGLENCLTDRVLTMRGESRLPAPGRDINIASALRLLSDVSALRRQLAEAALNRPLAVERQLWRLQGA